MKVSEVLWWQVFLYKTPGKAELHEYVKIPLPLFLGLHKQKVICGPPVNIPYSAPVNAIQLNGLRWVLLDGTHNVAEIRVNVSNAKQLETLAFHAKEVERIQHEMLAGPQSGRHKTQGEETCTSPKGALPVVHHVPRGLQVDPACISLQATLELFANFGVGREIEEAARHGTRRNP